MSAGGASASGSGRGNVGTEALRRGLVALGWVVLAAQAYSFLIYILAGRPFRPWSFVKIGWLYLLSFSRVGLQVTVGSSFSAIVNPGVHGETVYRVHLAFLLGTAFSSWLLFRAGQVVARGVDAGPLTRALAGAAVAPAYAVPAFLGSFLAVVRFPDQGVPDVRPVAWEALALPLAMAAVCGAAGGLAAAREELRATGPGRLTVRWVEGGWRGLLVGLGLALVGLLVLAAISPGGTGAYVRWLIRNGHAGALAFAHQLLSLPNHAMFILGPSTGGCDVLSAGRRTAQMLCAGRFIGPDLLLYVPFAHGVPSAADVGVATGPLPRAFLLFALAPIAATIAGGYAAAREVRSVRERAIAGAGAGVVWAGLVAAVAWASSVVLVIPPSAAGPGVRVTLGPAILRTAMLALVWGVVGGVLGSLVPRQAEGAPVPEPGEGPPEVSEPPRPTSV